MTNLSNLDSNATSILNATNTVTSPWEITIHDVIFFVYYYGIFIALTCINIPGNLLVLSTVLKHYQLRQPCNYYIASLAFSDFLIGIVYPIYNISHLEHVPEISRTLEEETRLPGETTNMPQVTEMLRYHIKSYVVRLALIGNRIGNWSVCRVIVCEVLALEICSSYHLVAITVTRYIAIVHPLRYHIYVTTKTTTIAIAVIWILSQGSSLVMYTMYNPGHSIKICRYELIFSLTHVSVLLVIQLFIPLAVMLVLYFRIAKIARRQARIIAIQESSITGNCKAKDGIIKNEMKSTVMVSLLLGCFTLSWSPMIIYFFYTITCTNPPCDVNRYIRATVRVLLYLNSSVNVFIYAGRLSEFRVRIKSDLRQYFGICMHFKKTKRLKKIQTDINLVSSLSKITINDATVETEQLK